MPRFYGPHGNAILVNTISHLAAVLLDSGAVRATKYLGEKLTVKGKLKTYRGAINTRARTAEILFTFGAPNYAERQFIAKRRKSGEPFPVKKVQLKFEKPPAKGKAA